MEELSFLEKVLANWKEIWLVLTTTAAAAAAAAALTPPPAKDDSWIAKIRKVIDILGWNWGFAKNKK